MRYLILLFICFSANADFAKISKIKNGSVSEYFTKAKACGPKCIKTPRNFNKNFHVVVDIMIDDLTKPVNTKSEIDVCTNQSDCESKNAVKTCVDTDEIVIMAEDFTDIYCSKLLRYDKKASGEKKVVVDATLKAAYELDVKNKNDAKVSKKSEINGAILTKLKGNGTLSQVQIKKLFLYILNK